MSKLVSTTGWRYGRCGPISAVLKLENYDLTPMRGEAVVQMMVSPLHRSDAAVINGTALGQQRNGSRRFPCVGGYEGVGKVCRAGADSTVKEGDMVWVSSLQGTWAKEVAVSGNLLQKVDPKHAKLAATASNFLMANHLLQGYRSLKSGDVVMQNGGSSLTSLAVSALAKATMPGVTVLTAASSGERFEDAKARHRTFGSEVFEYSATGCKSMKAKMGGSNAALFLNGVGGSQFDNFLKLMRPGGSDAVCYGAQNGSGLFFSGSNLIFPELTIHGFYLPKYLSSLSYEERQTKLDFVLHTLASANFSYPTISVSSLEDLPNVWDEAFLKGGKKALVTIQA